MTGIATTPEPPCYAVIFTSQHASPTTGYDQTAQRMLQLAAQQEGFLGVESARDNIGLTVSYWRDLDSIARWKSQTEHQVAQQRGRKDWYTAYQVRVARVEKSYAFGGL